MTCFKYQVFLHDSEGITYLNAILLRVVTESDLGVIRPPPPPTTASPPPSLYGSIPFTHLEENFSMVKLPFLCKNKGKTRTVEEPSHEKELSLTHMCKIGLTWKFPVEVKVILPFKKGTKLK
jgi:hypothetical protein